MAKLKLKGSLVMSFGATDRERVYSLYGLAVVVKVVVSLGLFGSVVKLHRVPSKVWNHAKYHILIMRQSGL